ncbi:PAS domain S-box protein [Sediminibacterium sp.]|uniref:PAS domain S-box protein n=1 Tax=Sediminibacterium sp. TaxID=1917865 RepID=UPI00273566F6|nr:PAS domain S-box protein [Sediminibacterium sp.]MDP3392239.1 PAS domain S-box protein [Sediminibacterium sp.]MDP3566959.1 PAS domain S-box protein [Sediminibacterium sp.]
MKKSDTPISIAESYMGFGTWNYSIAAKSIECSQGTYALLGFESEINNLTTTDLLKFVSEDDSNKLKNLFRKAIKEKIGFEKEIKFFQKGGSKRVGILKAEIIVDETNSVTSIVGILYDITEKKTKEKFEVLVKNGADASIIINEDCIPTYISPSVIKITGHTEEEIINQKLTNFVHPEDLNKLLHSFLIAEKKQGVTIPANYIRIKSLNNEWIIFEIQFTNLLNDLIIEGFIINLRDVTSRENAIAELQLMGSAVKNISEAVIIAEAEPMDLSGPKVIFVNDAFCKMTGYTREEIVGKSPKILQGPNSDKIAIQNLSKAIKSWQKHETTLLNYKKNGEEYWINFNISPIKNDQGVYSHWVAIEKDITENKKREIERILLAEISKLFLNNQNINYLLTETLKFIIDSVQFSMGEIWLLSADKRNIYIAANGCTDEQLKGFFTETSYFNNIKKEYGLPGIAWKNKKIEIWKDITNNPNFIRKEAAKKYNIDLLVTIPLMSGDDVIGVMCLGLTKEKINQPIPEKLFHQLSTYLSAEIIRKQQELQLYNIFNSPLDIILIAGIDGVIKKVNPAVKQILSFDPSEIENLPFNHFIHPEDQHRSFKEAEKMLRGEMIPYFENRLITKTGNVKWIAWTFNPSKADNLVYGMGKDITEKKELETLLTKSNSLSGIGSWEFNLNDNTIFLSDRTKEILDIPLDFNAKVENGIIKFKEGNQSEIIQQRIEKCIEEGTSWDEEVLIETVNGNWKWVRSIGEGEFLNNKCIKVYGSIQDINDRKRVEQEIISSNERFNLVSQANNDLIWEWDIVKGETFRLGSPFFNNLGYTGDSINQNKINWIALIHPEDIDKVEMKRNHIFENTKETYWEDQYRFKKADGSYAYVYDRGFIVRHSNGKAIKMIGSTQNISKLKQSEIKLEELNNQLLSQAKEISASEKRYSELFHLSPLPMWVYDIDSLQFLEVNKAALKHYGYTEKEFLNMTIKDIRPKEDIPYLESQLKITRKHSTEYISGTFRHIKKNGEIITVEVQSNYISYSGKNARVILINDITERLEYINTIETKNQELQHIAWLQSHVIRAPVAKIMGIMHILDQVEIDELEKLSLQNDLVKSAQELDTVIHDIANKTHAARLK